MNSGRHGTVARLAISLWVGLQFNLSRFYPGGGDDRFLYVFIVFYVPQFALKKREWMSQG